MWLETIEISEVYITSSTLFKNLQTEHREKFRLHADKITSESSNTIRNEELETSNKLAVEQAEINNKVRATGMEL